MQLAGRQSTIRATRWVLGALVLVVVVVVTIAVTLLVTKSSSTTAVPATPSTPTPVEADTSDIASATDDGPVGVITDEPTCASWAPIADTYAAQADKGWNNRDPSVPATEWSTAQRAMYDEMAIAMRSAADETVALAKLTPHRVMRELYEQAVAYWRAYADAVPTYEPDDDPLGRVATAASNAVGTICSAINWGSAAARAPLVSPIPAPYGEGTLGDTDNPERFLTEEVPVCRDWIAAAQKFDNDTVEWFRTDPNIPAAQWSPEQQATMERTALIMQSHADQIQNLGAQSLNSVFDDFASLATQYRRAFVQSFPTYTPADAHLANTAAELIATNSHACRATGVR